MMCGRFSLFHNSEEIRRRFRLNKWFREWMKRYNIAPEQQILIVYAEGGERIAQEVEWGLIPHWAKTPKPVINARSDALKEKPTFRDSLYNKRCLIIADGFYEWQKQGKEKQPYYISLKDGGLFAFAGLYDDWNQKRTATIITVEPNSVMKPIHDRMPAILDPKGEDTWLTTNNLSAATATLKPCPDEALLLKRVSRKVNDPKNEGVELLSAEKSNQMALSTRS